MTHLAGTRPDFFRTGHDWITHARVYSVLSDVIGSTAEARLAGM